MRLPRSLAAVVLSAALLAGCGTGDEPGEGDGPADTPSTAVAVPSAPATTSPAPTAAPAKVPAGWVRIKAADYTFAVPKGWRQADDLVPAADVVAIDATDTEDGFSDNINVLRLDPAPVTDLDRLEAASEAELRAAKARDVKVLDRTVVAGAEAIRVSSAMTSQGVEYVIQQANPVREDVSYVITFSFSKDVTPAAQVRLLDKVLRTWRWTS